MRTKMNSTLVGTSLPFVMVNPPKATRQRVIDRTIISAIFSARRGEAKSLRRHLLSNTEFALTTQWSQASPT
jgi:hypothetical protein